MYKEVLKVITPPIAWPLLLGFSSKINHLKLSTEKKLMGESIDSQLPTGEDLIRKKNMSIRGIFMHIHKCAGTSLIATLERHPEVISCVARPGNFPMRTGRNRIPEAIWDNSFKFTLIRNPYARVVSAYRMFIKSKTWKLLFPTFKDFVKFLQWSNIDEHYVEEEIPIGEYVKTIGNLIHHCSSYSNPKYHLDRMDYIGRLENIQKDLRQISEVLDIDLQVVPRLNQAHKAYDYREYYSTDLKRAVYKLYQTDIERFEYSF